MRAEVNVARAVGVPFSAFERGFARGYAARMPLLFSFRRCLLRTATPLECAVWCRAIESRASRSNSFLNNPYRR